MQQSSLNLNLSLKKTRKREFLQEMEQVVPWGALVERMAPYYPEGRKGRPPFSLQTMLRVCCSSELGCVYDRLGKVPIQQEAKRSVPAV